MGRNLDRVAGIAEARQGVSVPINRKFMRFVDGGGVTWTLTDDPANDEVEVSAVAAGSGGAPTGSIMAYAGTSVPVGWLECDGTAYGRTGGDPSPQVALFAAIGTTWGPGDGSTTFNVPNLARRTFVGRGGVGTGTLGNAVGNVGGAEAHTLSVGEMPSHGHSSSGTHDHNDNFGNGSVAATGNPLSLGFAPDGVGSYRLVQAAHSSPSFNTGTSANGANLTISNNGGSGAHNNMQPSAVVMMIIKT